MAGLHPSVLEDGARQRKRRMECGKMSVVLPGRDGRMHRYESKAEWLAAVDGPVQPHEPPKKMTWPEARERLKKELGIQKF